MILRLMIREKDGWQRLRERPHEYDHYRLFPLGYMIISRSITL